MMKNLFVLLLAVVSFSTFAQFDASLFRYPDVSKTQIVFVYANDVWIVPKEGGIAMRLSSPPGGEMMPKFSPDGRQVAFSALYDGNRDVYVLPVNGDVPKRLTSHGYPDRVVDWTNDGKSVLFASRRASGKERFSQFYTIPAVGGFETKLPFAYAEYGSYSPDGKQMAVVIRTEVGRNWKRYRGGDNGDIRIYDFEKQQQENISLMSNAADDFPMWHENFIYFLSDRGAEMRMNLWRYHISTKQFEQLTKFTDYDVHYPSQGPDDIVFEAGGKLYLYSFATRQQKEIKVSVVTDFALMKPKTIAVNEYIQHAAVSPDGNRVLMEARGDIFSLPAENGFVKNLTMTSGVAERYPSWSPNGKTVAYWSDKSGEYELWIMDPNKDGSAKKITSYGAGFRYGMAWSPDNKKIAFIDKAGEIKIYNVLSGNTENVDKGLYFTHGNMERFAFSWSSDSRWLAYNRDLENLHFATFIYDDKEKTKHQVTSGFYSSYNSVFDPTGKYLFVLTSQNFNPIYSDADNTFIYANSNQLAAISLQKSTPSILQPKNDTVLVNDEEKPKVNQESKNKKSGKGSSEKIEKEKKDSSTMDIDFDGIEDRLELLPIPAGNINSLSATKEKVLYIRQPNTGAVETSASIKYYDIDKREEKTILSGANDFIMSNNQEKLLVSKSGTWALITPTEGAKFEKPLRITEMQMTIDPKKEWSQIFNDTWRIERDYFYDGNMHGTDWAAIKEKYARLLEFAVTREDVDFIIGEMMGELNASHTYHSGGDFEKVKTAQTGYLGINWEAAGVNYKVKKIIRGASWDAETSSPLTKSGIKIREGDYILAVNGIPITTDQEPYAAFQGLADKTVEITFNQTPSFSGAKKAIVKTLADEHRLRNLNWIENMRKRVDEATNGEVGYIYVPSTGIDGQNELMRQFNAQWNKKALIIDERFNNGGQIPDRFIEMLNRTPLSFVATRDGKPWQWPFFANFGPKVMLINGWSGSGGDAFPDYFRKKNLGPLIGGRTWGGLIGISGYPLLVDGGQITAPSFRLYNPDGTWFREGHGVDPDIEVDEDLGAMANGVDPQLEKAIEEIKKLLGTKSFKAPKVPAPERR
ncbi:MAG TPA: PDZ domain-containing protein [Niabella sp.]|nr:PDZ domain-containing protein [Niabella sp.]HOZ96724.1 PDZ domain-containing protein [Niabella sp.]HQW16444.1 PDZ domain-containing protein [Niabella sp.]HQX19343.1 PDZ domain-containing protein [Niabella sp.]HQX42826.1 PDZ domain-containing protein [Niabella sp.]